MPRPTQSWPECWGLVLGRSRVCSQAPSAFGSAAAALAEPVPCIPECLFGKRPFLRGEWQGPLLPFLSLVQT